ncbi:ABC transporter ATP-binding protein [Actinomyces howellii]|uniref:Daunorubicin/doxorubicin resistance ATP-binding protein DrrA n=1 Tax=Actinomyces howellii TaxID=52771 RepID=A0A3S4V4H7_9ACTO|nr:ABC transporter ATP-binding protein [Actinomyces howellii]VEG27978.1 Daunorubicin/doxorubicin resistance ATP-binding protein DrrA [Actinomyces howellii]
MSSAPAAIEIRSLTKSYGDKEVLRGLDLSVPAGSVLALLGPNGAGKTTTVEILQGLRRRDGGEVRVLGEDPQRSPRAWRARIGVVSQTAADLDSLTVTEAVSHVSRFFADPDDVATTIDRVGLSDDARTRVSRLSGGRRRRLDVALAIVGRPELLFLDEPTTGFDPKARRAFWTLVEDLAADGTTVLLTTHYLDEAARLADEVAIVVGGRVVEHDAPEVLARQAGDQRTVSWIEDGAEHTEHTLRPTAVVQGLAARLAGPDGEIPGLQVHTPTLEDHYLDLVSLHHEA